MFPARKIDQEVAREGGWTYWNSPSDVSNTSDYDSCADSRQIQANRDKNATSQATFSGETRYLQIETRGLILSFLSNPKSDSILEYVDSRGYKLPLR